MGILQDKLIEYTKSDYYPLHMPGHKRNTVTNALTPFAKTDITEIEGFDNLHASEDVLSEIQKKAANIYGADESFYLINGSSCGILASICAVKKEDKKLLMVRGCHKSAYHGLFVSGQEAYYLWPEPHKEFGCEMPVTVTMVAEALERYEDIGAVLIVSPTYEGLHANVREIAELVHSKNIPLIVDAAHGAHLGFDDRWEENACRQGADLSIMSLHKTLPSPTQTAVLHVKGNRVDLERLRRYLRIYQSSSPSYPMMAAMEEAIDYTEANKKELFDRFYESWMEMTKALSACQSIIYLNETNLDIGKLVIKDSSGTFSGKALYDILRKEYHLQPEMAAGEYCLLMFTLADTKEGFIRTKKALLEIDGRCKGTKEADSIKEIHDRCVRKVCALKDAWEAPKRKIPLHDAVGQVAGEFVNLYPPGRPILVPGEEIKEEIVHLITGYVRNHYTVQGIMYNGQNPEIYVLE